MHALIHGAVEGFSGLVHFEVSFPFASRLFDSKSLCKKSGLNERVGGLEKATNRKAGPLGAAAPPDLLSLGAEGGPSSIECGGPQGRVLRTDNPAPQSAAPLSGWMDLGCLSNSTQSRCSPRKTSAMVNLLMAVC